MSDDDGLTYEESELANLPATVGFTPEHEDIKTQLIRRVVTMLCGKTESVGYGIQELPWNNTVQENLTVRVSDKVKIILQVETSK